MYVVVLVGGRFAHDVPRRTLAQCRQQHHGAFLVNPGKYLKDVTEAMNGVRFAQIERNGHGGTEKEIADTVPCLPRIRRDPCGYTAIPPGRRRRPVPVRVPCTNRRSEEHTSELQSLMRISN